MKKERSKRVLIGGAVVVLVMVILIIFIRIKENSRRIDKVEKLLSLETKKPEEKNKKNSDGKDASLKISENNMKRFLEEAHKLKELDYMQIEDKEELFLDFIELPENMSSTYDEALEDIPIYLYVSEVKEKEPKIYFQFDTEISDIKIFSFAQEEKIITPYQDNIYYFNAEISSATYTFEISKYGQKYYFSIYWRGY